MTTSPADLGRNVARGSVALAGRQVLVAVATLLASVVLARHLTTAEFGFYGLLLLLTNMSALLVQAGIAPAMVRLPDEPQPEEYRAAFGAQLVVGTAFGLAVACLGPAFQRIYPQVYHVAIATAIVAVGAALVPLTSISMVRLERSVRMAEVGLMLAIQPVCFAVGAVIAVEAGGGVVGIALAFVASTLLPIPVGIALTAAPPRPKWAPRRISHIWHFAVLQWLQNAINVLKDSINPIVLAAVLGASAAGYVNWALQTSILGAYFVNAFARLLFPWFARLHQDRTALANAATVALTALSLVTAPVVCGLLFSLHDVIDLVYGQQWRPASLLLLVFSAANIAVPVSMVSIAVLNACGNARDALYASIGWMLVTWVFVVALVGPLGTMAYGVANSLCLLVTVWLGAKARRMAPYDWIGPVLKPWLAAAGAFGVAKIASLFLLRQGTWCELALAGALGVLLFGAAVFATYRRTLVPRLKEMRTQ